MTCRQSQTSESESPSLDSQFSSQQYSFGSSQESIPPALEREEEESDDEEEEAQEFRFFDVEGEEGISELAWTSPLTKYIIEAYSAC